MRTPRFIQELRLGHPVYIYLLDGEFIHAVKLLDWIHDEGSTPSYLPGFLDVQDEEGDWVSVNLDNVTNSFAVKK